MASAIGSKYTNCKIDIFGDISYGGTNLNEYINMYDGIKVYDIPNQTSFEEIFDAYTDWQKSRKWN